MICNAFHIGWRRANGFLEKLKVLGILGDIYAKLPRAVLPDRLDELTPQTMSFLNNHGYTTEQIITAINAKCGEKT